MLQRLSKSAGPGYVGFNIIDDNGIERVFHSSCIEPYLNGEVFDGPWWRDSPEEGF
jgi:hypothetical protein